MKTAGYQERVKKKKKKEEITEQKTKCYLYIPYLYSDGGS